MARQRYVKWHGKRFPINTKEPSSWSPPSQGTTDRQEMPRDAFFDPDNRKYPYKRRDSSGNYVISRKGVIAALKRAAQQGRSDIVAKARRILEKLDGQEGK